MSTYTHHKGAQLISSLKFRIIFIDYIALFSARHNVVLARVFRRIVMSIWNNLAPSYKGEHIYKLSKVVDHERLKKHLCLFSFVIAGDIDLFRNLTPGDQSNAILGGKPVDGYFQAAIRDDVYMDKILSLANDWSFGSEGTLKFVKSIDLNESIIAKNRHANLSLNTRLVSAMSMFNSHFNQKDMQKVHEVSYTDVEFNNKWVNLSKSFTSFLGKIKMPSVRREHKIIKLEGAKKLDAKSSVITKLTPVDNVKFNYLPSNWIGEHCVFKIIVYEGIFFFMSEKAGNYIFTRKDMSRLINFFDALSGLAAAAQYDKHINKHHYLEEISKIFFKMYYNTTNVNGFVEAWISACRVIKSRLAGPLSLKSYALLKEERVVKGHDETVPLDIIEDFVSKRGATASVIAQSIARVAPPPDYDVTLTFSNEKIMHHEKNPVGAEINPEAGDLYDKFTAYNRWAFINQYFKQFNIVPGVPRDPNTEFGRRYNETKKNRDPPRLNHDEALLVDLKGVLEYKKRDEDYYMYFKDSTMCASGIAANTINERPDVKYTNQIVHMLTADEKIDLAKARNDIKIKEHPIRTAIKVESGKEEGRLFFIYDLVDKILMSELEENISEFLIKVPGNAVGVSTDKLKKIMMNIIHTEAIPSVDIAPVYMSDDISKWSPHMPKKVQQDSANFWAEIYNEPWISDMPKIDVNDTVICNIMNFHATYNSDGANKEGTTGKRITYLMINMKAFTTSILRKKRIVQGAARLLTFLDDGLTAFDVSCKNYIKDASEAIETYAANQKLLGYELKLSKCYPSDRYLTFLNYEYHKGVRLYDPLKSMVKMYTRKTTETLSLPERLRECATWAIGAAESGTPLMFLYHCYVARFIWEVSLWNHMDTLFDYSRALLYITPISFGGLGLITYAGITTGLNREAVAEGIASLKRIAINVPFLRKQIVKILNADNSSKSMIGIIRAPQTIVKTSPHLVETRIISALEERLITNSDSVYLKEFIKMASPAAYHEFARDIVNNNTKLSKVAIELIYEMTPLAYADKVLSKAKRSSTLIDLLGFTLHNHIMKANASDLKEVESHWSLYIE